MNLSAVSRPGLRLALLSFALTAIAAAQGPCTLEFTPGDAVAGVDGSVAALLPWDPDGAGPMPLHVVAAGDFRVAGDVISPNIAAYDPGSGEWLALGLGLPGLTRAVAQRPNGNLVAVSEPDGVFEWDGATWQQLGGTFSSSPNAVAILQNGDVVVGGVFTVVNGAPIHGIARWDGTMWHAMGAPLTTWIPGTITRLNVLPSGDLVATGLFVIIGGVPCSYIARWDGTAWHPYAAGSATPPYSMAVTSNGDVVASGSFATSTGTASIARWNGSAWQDIGVGLPMTFALLSPLPNNELLAIGPAGIWATNAGVWSQYAPWPQGTPELNCALALSSNDVFAGGYFEPSAIVPARNFARWQAGSWHATSVGNDNTVTAIAERPDGSFVVGGHFSTIGGQTANRLAHYDNGVWTAIASTAIGPIRHALARPNGEVVLVGEFPNLTTGGMDFVMKWSGGPITPLYGGLWGARVVEAMALARNGDVMFAYTDLATFGAGVARWNGTTLTFHALPTNFLRALLELPNGDWLLANALGSLLRWDGNQTTAFAPPLNGPITQLGQLPNGDLVAAGGFSAPMRVARWGGIAWQSLGTGPIDDVTSLAVLPNGDLIVSETRSSFPAWASRVWRWRGNTWTQLADTDGQADVRWSDAGAIIMYGEFTEAGGAANAYLARLETTCPADVQDLGGGCIGAAGPLALTATNQAWLVCIVAPSANALPAGALAIGVFGSSTTMQPLPVLHPLGTSGCNLLVTDDILLQFDVSAGGASPEIFVPNATALVGAQFYHQVLGIEVTTNGNLAAITSSNALLLTIGSL